MKIKSFFACLVLTTCACLNDGFSMEEYPIKTEFDYGAGNVCQCIEEPNQFKVVFNGIVDGTTYISSEITIFARPLSQEDRQNFETLQKNGHKLPEGWRNFVKITHQDKFITYQQWPEQLPNSSSSDEHPMSFEYYYDWGTIVSDLKVRLNPGEISTLGEGQRNPGYVFVNWLTETHNAVLLKEPYYYDKQFMPIIDASEQPEISLPSGEQLFSPETIKQKNQQYESLLVQDVLNLVTGKAELIELIRQKITEIAEIGADAEVLTTYAQANPIEHILPYCKELIHARMQGVSPEGHIPEGIANDFFQKSLSSFIKKLRNIS